jgi:hypothetical protein
VTRWYECFFTSCEEHTPVSSLPVRSVPPNLSQCGHSWNRNVGRHSNTSSLSKAVLL